MSRRRTGSRIATTLDAPGQIGGDGRFGQDGDAEAGLDHADRGRHVGDLLGDLDGQALLGQRALEHLPHARVLAGEDQRMRAEVAQADAAAARERMAGRREGGQSIGEERLGDDVRVGPDEAADAEVDVTALDEVEQARGDGVADAHDDAVVGPASAAIAPAAARWRRPTAARRP